MTDCDCDCDCGYLTPRPFHYVEWDIRHPVARKEHECVYCYGPIFKGSKYVRIIGEMENSGFFSHAAHTDCCEEC